MKNTTLIILGILLIILSPHLSAAPINKDQALKIAMDFYQSIGYILPKQHNTITWNFSNKVYAINFVTEPKHKGIGYVIVAGDDQISPILAFSTQGRLNVENDCIKTLISDYGNEIEIKQNGKEESLTCDTTYYTKKQDSCAPLLKDISWGQGSPYNQLIPLDADNSQCLVGCTAVALGQIMKYYNYPLQGNGTHAYIKNNNNRILSANTNYNALNIAWEQIKGKYSPKDTLEAKEGVCKILRYCALSVEANFSAQATSAGINNAKNSLIKHFRYHPSLQLIEKKDMPDQTFKELLYRELDAKRPMIFSAYKHAFICDGYIDDFFHFNWGWNGNMNGYFKLSALTAGMNNFKIPERVIVNIFPDTIPEQKKNIFLDKNKSLKESLSIDSLLKLSSLKITGNLKGQDLMLLRKMGGATNSIWEEGGNLRKLDLSEANIISDFKNPYLFQDLKKEKISITCTQSSENGNSHTRRFYFEYMNDGLWKAFCNFNPNDYSKERKYTQENNSYYCSHFQRKNTIGYCLFKNCTNLQKIKLPNKTKEIMQEAFSGCILLESIEIPSSVKNIERGICRGCISLESISVNEKNKLYKSLEGVLYNKKMSKLILYPISKKETEYIMPPKVTELSAHAFAENIFLRKIKLSPFIKKIPKGTFSYCHSLQTLNLPDYITDIDDEAFCNCENLAIIYLSNNLHSIGIDVFKKCNSLTDIYFKGPIPPSVIRRAFTKMKNCNEIRLWVPKGSREAYKSSNWNYFKNINEIGE